MEYPEPDPWAENLAHLDNLNADELNKTVWYLFTAEGICYVKFIEKNRALFNLIFSGPGYRCNGEYSECCTPQSPCIRSENKLNT